MKSTVPIAFCLSRNFLLLLKVALDSLMRSSKKYTFYRIYVVADDLTEDDMRAIDAIAAPFANSCKVIHRKIDNGLFRSAGFDAKNGSFSYYYRLDLPLLIPEHDKIIYSAADVLFFSDLSKYYATDLGDNYLGVVQFNHPCYFTDDYEFDGKYFASGNLLMNLKACREINLLERISLIARRYTGKLLYHDQDCLNVMFYDQVKYLPLNFCVNQKLHQNIARDRYFSIHLRKYEKETIYDAIRNPDIVHYTGPKPDKDSPSCKLWQRTY